MDLRKIEWKEGGIGQGSCPVAHFNIRGGVELTNLSGSGSR
jgi:hypothetical protein